LGAPEVEGVGTGSGGFDVAVTAGEFAAPARGATEEVTGGVPATEALALGSEGAAVAVAGEVVAPAEGVGGAVVAAEALPEGGVTSGAEVAAGVCEPALPTVSLLPPMSGQTK
jgi:hypothetical protein